MESTGWFRTRLGTVVAVAFGTLLGCGSSGNGDVGATGNGATTGSDGAATATNGVTTAATSAGTGTSTTATGASSNDTTTTGANTGSNGASSATTAANTGTNGASTGSNGAATTSASTGATSDGGAGCTVGPWPAADPAKDGPFATTTENNVGPAAGVGADGGPPPMFTLFRPTDLAQGGLCHPVITWGNGTGSSPSLYGVLLKHLASHGFVVIASNSPNVAQGTPAPMVAGVTWVIAENADPTSPMYQRIDTTHVGATGHSQGGFATTSAGSDSHITTIAPICGATAQRNLHGPALLFCGGMDTTVPCSTIQTAFNGITNQPVMLAELLSATHVSWVTFRSGSALSPIEVAVTAWMRVQLMGDTALRSWFYGPSCTLCQDSAWQITQKMLDQ